MQYEAKVKAAEVAERARVGIRTGMGKFVHG